MLLSQVGDRRVYFVHSFHGTPAPENADWVLATADYGGEFIAAIQKGNVCATQFHPEKSGQAGLDILRSFLEPGAVGPYQEAGHDGSLHGLAKRVIACLDVRANDRGDLVVTKGDQYDVRESTGGQGAAVASWFEESRCRCWREVVGSSSCGRVAVP